MRIDFATLPEPTSLSSEEQSVVSLLRSGYSDEQIAAKLSLSISEVKKNLKEVHTKLGLQDRLELAFYAGHHGM